MMDPTTITTIIAAISLTIAICGVLVSASVANSSKSKGEAQEKVSNAIDVAKLSAQFEALLSSINEVKHTVQEINKKFDDHSERIIMLESDIKTLYKRCDQLYEEFKELEDKHNDSIAACALRKDLGI